jgi:hypothetical protein
MNDPRARAALALLLLPCLYAAPAAAAEARRLVDSLLAEEGRFEPEERARLERGQAVVKILDTDDRSEVFSVAALRVSAGADAFLALLRDGSGPKLASNAIQAGRLSPQPQAGDFAGDVLEARDLDSLKSCRLGYCKVRLPAEAMERFRREVDWRSPRSAEHATAIWHELLAAYASSYSAAGNQGLTEYADDDPPVRVAASTGVLLGRLRWLQENVPELHAHLQGFPPAPPGVEGELYWLKERFWRKPVVSLNHLAWVARTAPRTRLVVAADKQLYANHYFEASIRVLLLAEEETASGPLSTVVILTRSRADAPRDGFNWLERALLNRLVKGHLERQLRWVEAQLQAQPSPAGERSSALHTAVKPAGQSGR